MSKEVPSITAIAAAIKTETEARLLQRIRALESEKAALETNSKIDVGVIETQARRIAALEQERAEALAADKVNQNHKGRVMAALGNGADEAMWRPGHLWADEAARHIRNAGAAQALAQKLADIAQRVVEAVDRGSEQGHEDIWDVLPDLRAALALPGVPAPKE